MAKPRILVCDDEAVIRKAVRLVLKQDYELVFAADGEETLQQVQAQSFDLVLLDIKMPGKNGLEVLQELMLAPAPARVLMLTAYQSVELAQRATRLGALDYVTKPFTREGLANAVDRTLYLQPWQRPQSSQHV